MSDSTGSTSDAAQSSPRASSARRTSRRRRSRHKPVTLRDHLALARERLASVGPRIESLYRLAFDRRVRRRFARKQKKTVRKMRKYAMLAVAILVLAIFIVVIGRFDHSTQEDKSIPSVVDA